MTTMSEIVLVVCLVRQQLLQYMVAIIQYASEEVVIAIGGKLARQRPSLTPRSINQSIFFFEQKLQCIFLSAAVANPHLADDVYINFANTTDHVLLRQEKGRQ